MNPVNETDALAEALRGYQRLVSYCRRFVNDEEWATHGDWKLMFDRAANALTAYNKSEGVNAMRKDHRRGIAERAATIAAKHGAKVEIADGYSRVDCAWPGLISCAFDIDDLHKGGILCSWFGARKKIDLVQGFPLGSVNPHHQTKATLYGDTADEFERLFERACESVADGYVFEPEEEGA